MSDNNRDLMPYHLYLIEQRLLAENIDGHLVDLGTVEQDEGGYHWQLDGIDAKGTHLASTDALFQDIKQHLTFLFLDGQFTSLPDLSDRYDEQLASAPMAEIVLHELRDDDEDQAR